MGRHSHINTTIRLKTYLSFVRIKMPIIVAARLFACWDCGFESCRRQGSLSLVIIVCCQVEVFTSVLFLVQRDSTACGVSECDREASIMSRAWPT